MSRWPGARNRGWLLRERVEQPQSRRRRGLVGMTFATVVVCCAYATAASEEAAEAPSGGSADMRTAINDRRTTATSPTARRTFGDVPRFNTVTPAGWSSTGERQDSLRRDPTRRALSQQLDQHGLATAQGGPQPAEALSHNPYTEHSNDELAGLVDRWVELGRDERRWFFVEVRRRLMANQSTRGYVRVRPSFGGMRATPANSGVSRQYGEPPKDSGGYGILPSGKAFGLGFERRRVSADDALPAGSQPKPASLTLPSEAPWPGQFQPDDS